MTVPPLPTSAVLLARSALTLARRGGEVSPDAAPTRYLAPPIAAGDWAAHRAFAGGSEAPLTALYPLAQRAQLARLLAPDFPLALPGMIHVANTLTTLGPLAPELGLTLDVSAGPAEEGRVELVVVMAQGGVPVAECRSLYQARGRRSPRGPRPEPQPAPTEPPTATATWPLGADAGRRYAALSGDWNPIHLWPWSARLFGFDRPIYHGMAAVARVAGLVEAREGRPVSAVSARFRRPMPLPGELHVAVWAEDGQGRFRVTSVNGETLHLDGTYATGGLEAGPHQGPA